MNNKCTKTALLAGVSLVAIVALQPSIANAADLPRKAPVYKAAPVVMPPAWTWWIEGGASQVSGGDTNIGGFGSAPALGWAGSAAFSPDAKKKWGLEGAVGFDYRWDSAWHLSGQFRYGQSKKSTTHSPSALFNVPTTTTATTAFAAVAYNGSGSADRKESHWLADFMVGRDMNIGLGNTQVKVGVRVAEIRGKTTGSASWQVNTAVTATTVFATKSFSYEQSNKFLGIGPRLALDGSVPLGGAWSFDYNVGVAALFGSRKTDQTVTTNLVTNLAGTPVTCLAGCPVAGSDSSSGTVFNFDAQPGISYAFNRNVKLTASYRFDGYWKAMRTVDANNNFTNVDRFYQGGFLRLSFTN